MRFLYRRWRWVAILGVCVCAMLNLCACEWRAWRIGLGPAITQTAVEKFYARYEPIRQTLPDGAIVDFVVDKENCDEKAMGELVRMMLCRYAVLPKRLAVGQKTPWVIVDSDRKDIVPEVAASGNWELRADFKNGARLYYRDMNGKEQHK